MGMLREFVRSYEMIFNDANDLKKRTLTGFFWSFIDGVSLHLIQFAIFILLARFLLPEAFGLIGMLAIFMEIAQSFVDSGFGQALIQKKSPSYTDECSIFFFNLVIGIISACFLCMVAPHVAAFYGQPILVPVMRVLSLTQIINAFGMIQLSILNKSINFKRQFKINIIAVIVSGIVGISMAFYGYGVWSLVGHSLTNTLIKNLLLWIANPWRPSMLFSLDALAALYGFGSKLLLTGLINTIFQNIYLLVIGKFYSAVELGYYSSAKKIQGIPPQLLAITTNRVFFPVVSSIQDDPLKIKELLSKILRVLAFINIPLMFGLIAIAKPLVICAMTAKWIDAIEYIQLLCLVGLLLPLQMLNLNALMAIGRSDLILRLELIKKTLICISILLTYRWGVNALIYGQIILSFFGYFLNSYYVSRLIGYTLKEQIADCAPYFAFGGIMAGLVYQLQSFPFPNMIVLLLMQIVMGVMIFALLNIIFQPRAYKDICSIIMDRTIRYF